MRVDIGTLPRIIVLELIFLTYELYFTNLGKYRLTLLDFYIIVDPLFFYIRVHVCRGAY